MELVDKETMFKKLMNRGWSAFYSEYYWINPKKGFSDYSGIPPCEAYVREFTKLKGEDLFIATIQLDAYQNENNLLYISSTSGTNTYDIKDLLKEKYQAKWDSKNKRWYVNSYHMKNPEFHNDIGYCKLSWKKGSK